MKAKKKTKNAVKNNVRDQIADQYEDIPLLFMDPPEYYDQAIIGIMRGNGKGKNNSEGISVAYDYDKVIAANMKMGMSEEEADEFFEYNQIGAYVGEYTPVFIYKIGERK